MTEIFEVEVAHSEVESFLICERRHFYNYGLRIRGTTVSQALYRGSLGHLALQTYYQAILDGSDKPEAEGKAYAALYTLGAEMHTVDELKIQTQLVALLAAYFKHYQDDDYQPALIEKQIKLEIADGIVMPFTVDAIMSTTRGFVVVDHKFCWNFFNSNVLMVLPQLVKYMAALRQTGFKVGRAEYNELRYREVQGNFQFRRTPLDINQSRVERVLAEHIAVGERIGKRKRLPLEEWDRKSLRVANKFSCEKCPFITICAADLNGQPRDILLRTQYEIAPDRYAHVERESD